MSNKSGLQKAAGAAQHANALKNIIKAGMSGGWQAAAIEAAKAYAPQLIKIAIIVAVVMFFLPVIIISSLPSVLFGWGDNPSQDLKDRKDYATTMESHYAQISSYKTTAITEIEDENSNDDDTVTSEETGNSMDMFWYIAIDGVRHKQDVFNLNEDEIKQLIKDSFEVETERNGKNVSIKLTALSPDELMDKLGYTDEEKNWARLLYNTTTDSQIISATDPDYIASYGTDYSGITFGSGSTQVVYYNQLDSRWANILYGRSGTIGEAGCGPTALAIVVSTLTDKNVDPIEVSKWSVANGGRCEGSGSYHSLIPNGAKHYGLTVEGAKKTEGQKVVDALSAGKLVIVIMNPGHFTGGGHFIVLRGVTASGKILVADPASYSRSGQEWDLSIILNEARGDASAGGPFWICSRN